MGVGDEKSRPRQIGNRPTGRCADDLAGKADPKTLEIDRPLKFRIRSGGGEEIAHSLELRKDLFQIDPVERVGGCVVNVEVVGAIHLQIRAKHPFAHHRTDVSAAAIGGNSIRSNATQ
jgi:hypothetical protein